MYQPGCELTVAFQEFRVSFVFILQIFSLSCSSGSFLLFLLPFFFFNFFIENESYAVNRLVSHVTINKKFIFYCSCFACWSDRKMKGFIAGDKFQELLETTNALFTLGSTKHVKSFPCGRCPSGPSEIVPIPRRIKILVQFPSKSARRN